MNMNPNRNRLIASLADELEPVRRFRLRDGALLVALAVLASLIGVEMVEGLWRGVLTGEPAPFFWVTNGLLLLLGLTTTAAVLAMASPAVGKRYDAPKWASAMLGVLPIAAIISFLPQNKSMVALVDSSTLHCVVSSLAAALVSGFALTLWLRRGAPVSHQTAGWFTGIAAGSLGTLAYGFSCRMDTVTHLGIWHIAPVAISALVGRIAVPWIIRW